MNRKIGDWFAVIQHCRKKLFSSIVIDLKVNEKSATPAKDIIENEENDFESSFSDIVVEAKIKQEAQEVPLTTS